MSITLNADTSSGLVMTSDTSGEIKLQSAGVDIATVDSSGITMASGKTLPAASLTGALPAIDGSALTGVVPDKLSTASGSAPSYSARAWVNFNGTGTVAIRESGNVSSITDNGTGDYTVNFTTAMPDANYSVNGLGQYDQSNTTTSAATFLMIARFASALSSSSVRVSFGNAGGSSFDASTVAVSIFR